MSAKYTIIVAYKNKKHLMIYNPERGWEFPGGKIQKNETPKQAAEREFIEETAYQPKNLKKTTKQKNGIVFSAETGPRKNKKSEYTVGYFKKPPKNLSFSKKEYKEILRNHKKTKKHLK
ncbi:NUDIX domain-containing protein [Methanonatronarchaeum sp. AMET-Sl]|uniref:NUDIX domain-containing protein n=1 Tax=Methanonatronarchaeum sp. AMET-Sl TaxID=3037654 RepID=UPI00244DA169|nr:NUDIX domain-containing protein [Methanonatronarchaeum sp. AMET-Sl]WGI17397.1 NUDIX domain-containing protein [Methanonatronarchaeum sp. AMET-Sl]